MTGPGWLPDPAGRHEYRYFDGKVWTDNVADRGVASSDAWEPPVIPTREGFRQFSKWADKQLNDAASWVNRRGRKLPADELSTVDAEPSSSLLGQWSGLAGAVTKYGVAVGGVPGGGELLGILHAVSGTEDAQARLLRSIDAKVDALVKGPYNTGRTHLREAQRLDVGDPQQRVHIEDAKTCFFQAHGQATSVQSRSLVEYHLGLTWLLLGRRDDAVHWFAQSHASAMTVANELANRADNVKVLHSPNTTAAAVWFYPAGVVILGMKFQKLVAAKRARDTLADFVPFIACAAHSHNSVTGRDDDNLPALRLIRVSDDNYELTVVSLSSEPGRDGPPMDDADSVCRGFG